MPRAHLHILFSIAPHVSRLFCNRGIYANLSFMLILWYCIAGPAGVDPTPMTSKSNLTADVAGRIKYGDNMAIDHQASSALSSVPSMRR